MSLYREFNRRVLLLLQLLQLSSVIFVVSFLSSSSFSYILTIFSYSPILYCSYVFLNFVSNLTTSSFLLSFHITLNQTHHHSFTHFVICFFISQSKRVVVVAATNRPGKHKNIKQTVSARCLCLSSYHNLYVSCALYYL